ncbi:uncharacterized protein LOC141724275 [Apium graveolens]|uniref:uncharacterized protein LOC141724275 n=1 Tax=Apium graveolens TaxID=4045 RepID=UPI003D7ABEF7
MSLTISLRYHSSLKSAKKDKLHLNVVRNVRIPYICIPKNVEHRAVGDDCTPTLPTNNILMLVHLWTKGRRLLNWNMIQLRLTIYQTLTVMLVRFSLTKRIWRTSYLKQMKKLQIDWGAHPVNVSEDPPYDINNDNEFSYIAGMHSDQSDGDSEAEMDEDVHIPSYEDMSVVDTGVCVARPCKCEV